MRRRSAEIIQKIIQDCDHRLTVKDLAFCYHVSQKTLRNDLKEINQFLRTIPIREIKVTETGELKLGDDFDEDQVKRYLFEMDAYMYKLSPKERQIYIIMKLAVADGYITMGNIAEELYVSRITIVNDMEIVKEKLKGLKGTLILDSGKGMLLECEEKERIELLAKMYRSLAINLESEGFFQRMILNQMQTQYSFSGIFDYMQEYMQANNLVFVEDIFYDIVLYLFVIFNFSDNKGRIVDSKASLDNIDHMILYAGHMLKTPVTENMLSEFQCYIKEHKLYSFVKTVDEIELYKVIMKFVSHIDREINFHLVQDAKLLDSLLMHIRSMKDWGNYEVELPKEQDASINYEWLEKLVYENIYILENFLTYKLSSNMIKSIVIHICVAMIRNRRYLQNTSVVIVCPGSMATGKYLEAQIKNYFNFDIIGVLAVHEVVEELKRRGQHVDFIISTVSIPTDEYQVIRVHPFLKMKDLNLIQKLTFQKQKVDPTTIEYQMERLIHYVNHTIENECLARTLSRQIQDTMIDYKHLLEKDRHNVLAEFLTVERMELEEGELFWKEAMRRSAAILEREHCITGEYIRQAIRQVEEFGDYIVVSRGIALAHANPRFGVLKDGLSLLILRNGVSFTETKEKVYLLFCFASTGERDYLELLKEIFRIGRIKGRVERVLEQKDMMRMHRALTEN